MILIENLTKEFGKTRAVDSLNLEIKDGEVFGFLGPNGAGKTTTLKIMAGLLKPTYGRVVINGLDIWREPERAKRIIGFVPDRPFLYGKLTGREFLNFIGDLYEVEEEREKRIEEMLELFDLLEWADELIESYSHGMKQRLVMAGAFLHNPSVFIVDEPMIGLDPIGIRMLKNLFRKMQEMGRTVFMSTHILEIAEEVCTKIGIINNGKLIAEGTIDELRKKAKTDSPDLETIFLRLTGREIPIK
jgi:ABC-2 type transport system ATP-binding protein